MRRAAENVLLVAVVVATAAGFLALYRLRIRQGDVYPAYSSFRADPLGTRALFESLQEIPGVRVERNFTPLDQLLGASPRTTLLAGLPGREWLAMPRREYLALDENIRAGSRLVVAFHEGLGLPAPAKPVSKPEAPPAPKDAGGPEGRDDEDEALPEAPADLKARWGIEPHTRGTVTGSAGARREPGAAPGLPDRLAWGGALYFAPVEGSPWEVVYRAGGRPVIVERALGRGTLVLMADSYLLSNEALTYSRAPALLSWLVGSSPRVEFDESHLGGTEEGGVAKLARRYGLTGAAATLFLLALLYVWRTGAVFVPPFEEPAAAALECNHTSSLEALLVRAIAPGDLMAACLAHWRPTASAAEARRVGAASPGGPALPAYNAAARALGRRKFPHQP